MRFAGIALETQQSIWAKVFLSLSVFIAPSVGINAAAIKPPRLLDRVLLLLQWHLSHTIIAVLALPNPGGDSTKFSGLNRAFCSY